MSCSRVYGYGQHVHNTGIPPSGSSRPPHGLNRARSESHEDDPRIGQADQKAQNEHIWREATRRTHMLGAACTHLRDEEAAAVAG